LFSLNCLARPQLPSAGRAGPLADGAIGVVKGILGGATVLAGIAAVIWCSLRGWPARRAARRIPSHLGSRYSR
jgi:hypothetical protein